MKSGQAGRQEVQEQRNATYLVKADPDGTRACTRIEFGHHTRGEAYRDRDRTRHVACARKRIRQTRIDREASVPYGVVRCVCRCRRVRLAIMRLRVPRRGRGRAGSGSLMLPRTTSHEPRTPPVGPLSAECTPGARSEEARRTCRPTCPLKAVPPVLYQESGLSLVCVCAGGRTTGWPKHVCT